MRVTLDSVKTVFVDVLEGRMTREAADRWAHSVVQEFESGNVAFAPPGSEVSIWAGVMYLYGIDTMVGPCQYLHTDEDIRSAMREKLDNS